MITFFLGIGAVLSVVCLMRALVGHRLTYPHCARCGYQIACEHPCCPECGHRGDSHAATFRLRSWKRILILLLLTIALGASAVAVSARRSWIASLPTNWLVRVCPLEFEGSDSIGAWLDDELVERALFRCELTRAQDQVLWTRLVNRAVHEKTLFRTRRAWPEGMPVHLQLDPPWELMTTHAIRLIVKDEDGRPLVERRFWGAEDGLGGHYNPPEVVNRTGRFSIPADLVKDGQVSFLVEIHQSLSVWDLVRADVDRVPPQEDLPVRTIVARVPIAPTRSAKDMLTQVESTLETESLRARLKACLYLDTGALELSLPAREDQTYAIGMNLELLSDGEVIGHARRTIFQDDGPVYAEVAFAEGFNRLSLAPGATLKLHVTSDEEMAWRDFDKQSYWAGSFMIDAVVK